MILWDRRVGGNITTGSGGAFVAMYYLLKPSPTIPLNDPVSGTVRVTLAGPSSNINRWCMGGLYSTNVFGPQGHTTGGSGRNDANHQSFSVGPLPVSPWALIVDIAAHDTGPLTFGNLTIGGQPAP